MLTLLPSSGTVLLSTISLTWDILVIFTILTGPPGVGQGSGEEGQGALMKRERELGEIAEEVLVLCGC